jgi:hypothetical protein
MGWAIRTSEKQCSTKLTFAAAIEIALRAIKREGTQRKIARDYAVSQQMVHLISKGKKWPDAQVPAFVLFELQKLMSGITLASTMEDLCGLARKLGGNLNVDTTQFRLNLKIAA